MSKKIKIQAKGKYNLPTFVTTKYNFDENTFNMAAF